LRQRQHFNSVQWTSRLLAWGMALSVVLVSVCPPSDRPITYVPHNLEHFLAFAITSFFFALAYASRYLMRMGALILFTIGIEAVQLWVPGRHARVSDLTVNSLGVILGAWLAYTCYSIVSTRRVINYSAWARSLRGWLADSNPTIPPGSLMP